MTFGQWLSFRGRIRRKTFWLGYVVPVLAASVVAGILDTTLGLAPPFGADAVPADMAAQAAPISTIVSLLLLWPSLAGSIKRLHDRDRSGWWIGAFYMIGFSGALLMGMSAMVGIASGAFGAGMSVMLIIVFSLFMLAFGIWLIVETGFLRGTQGPNRYGPDPLGGMGAPHWQQQGVPPQQWQQPPAQGWQPPPQQGWQAPPQGGHPSGYGQPPPGYGQPPKGSVPPIRRE